MVKNVNAIDVSGFSKKHYNAEIKDILDKKANLATATAFNAKTNETKGEIPSITGLVSTNDVIDIKNNIPDVSTLIKKAGYDKK